jgi:hypothetical protein
MSGLLVLGIMSAVLADLVAITKDPPLLLEIKRRYQIIRNSLPAEERWHLVCQKHAIITGTSPGWSGPIASNVNKGYEIYICLDGEDVESAMYVFLHELAHLSVKEYDHSTTFWNNFRDLRVICSQIGVYKPAGATKYCGQTIKLTASQ